MKPTNDIEQMRMVRVLNGSGELIPPGAAVYLQSADTNGVFTGIKPASDNITEVVFNGAGNIEIGAEGVCFAEGVVFASLNSGDTAPVAGDIRGVKSNDWNLREGYTGFRTLSATTDKRFAMVSVQSSGTSTVTSTKMLRIVTPVVLHSSGLCVSAWTQKWAGPADTDYEDDQEVWAELL
jgi:hypothetical protein